MEKVAELVLALGAGPGVITALLMMTKAGQMKFIEINPRFGGGVPLSIRAGADSPRWLMELLLGRDVNIPTDGWTDGMYMLRYDEGIFLTPDQLPGP